MSSEYQGTPPPPPPPQRGWFSRNWKWVIPVGCVLPLLICCGAFGVVFYTMRGVIQNAEIVAQALVKAQTNKSVIEALGEPIQAASMPTFNADTSGKSSAADFTVPLSAPKAAGTLYVTAHKEGDKWVYSKLEVLVTGSGTRIDLLSKDDGAKKKD